MTNAARSCLCGHSRLAHEHYHRSATCALCGGCAHYRRTTWLAAHVDGLRRWATGHREGPVGGGTAPLERPHLYLVS